MGERQLITCSITSLQVNYTLPFVLPFFELDANANVVAQSIYRELSKVWHADLKDIRVRAGSTLADSFVGLTIFRGNGTVEVTAKDFSVSLRDALPRDRDTIMQALVGALEGLSEHVPINNWGNEVVNVAAELTIDDNCLVNDFLSRLAPVSLQGSASAPNVKFSQGLKIIVEKNGEWSCDISLVGRLGNPKALWLMVGVRTTDSGKTFQSCGERVQYFEDAVKAGVNEVFSKIGLNVIEKVVALEPG